MAPLKLSAIEAPERFSFKTHSPQILRHAENHRGRRQAPFLVVRVQYAISVLLMNTQLRVRTNQRTGWNFKSCLTRRNKDAFADAFSETSKAQICRNPSRPTVQPFLDAVPAAPARPCAPPIFSSIRTRGLSHALRASLCRVRPSLLVSPDVLYGCKQRLNASLGIQESQRETLGQPVFVADTAKLKTSLVVTQAPLFCIQNVCALADMPRWQVVTCGGGAE